ncbi:hypothetical protein G6F31_016104 [Rhizopus arrhizus]|nr:hypothetical protein G6F31_016104 [Rhizopus arrhizus]
MPEGVFSLLIGAGREIGEALVAHPAIKAVGFTGSRQGGLALVKIANGRPEPIPVYAEMSSINPVFVLPAALAARTDAIAQGFVESLVLGAGQFCTNPGLVLAIEGPDLDRFIASAGQALASKAPQVMLTPGIASAYRKGREQVQSLPGVESVAKPAGQRRIAGRGVRPGLPDREGAAPGGVAAGRRASGGPTHRNIAAR